MLFRSTNIPYLRRVGRLGKPVVLSTGMARLAEIERALEALEASGVAHEDITVLHCTTEYPTPWYEVNLRAMETIRDAFQVSVGYSDHTEGIEVPTAAVALGATLIEKHFTLDRNLVGPDHKASIDPLGLVKMVEAIRHVEVALGNGRKVPTASEVRNIPVARKSLVAACRIEAGELFSEQNVCCKRPGIGLGPEVLDLLLGKAASRAFEADELLEL